MADGAQASFDAAQYAGTWLATKQHRVKSCKDEGEGKRFKWRVRTYCRRTLNRARIESTPLEGMYELCRECEAAVRILGSAA